MLGGKYLKVHQPYRETSVPMAQMTGEFGYSYNFLSDNSKTVLFYIGGTALAGYESVNWGKRTMSDGATLQNKGAFIYGGAVALETEIYLSDAIALTASVKERLVWGKSDENGNLITYKTLEELFEKHTLYKTLNIGEEQ